MAERSAAAAALEAASDRVAQLIERWHREKGQADQARIEESKAEVRRALQEWARVSDEKLGSMRQRIRRGHGLMSAREAQDHWELLNQLKNDVYRYVEDRDSLLADYEPLTRAAAPEALQPFWELFDAAFEKLEWHKGSLLKYEETYRQQPAMENRNYEVQSRDDSRAVRDKLREFIDLARPLMQIIGRL